MMFEIGYGFPWLQMKAGFQCGLVFNGVTMWENEVGFKNEHNDSLTIRDTDLRRSKFISQLSMNSTSFPLE